MIILFNINCYAEITFGSIITSSNIKTIASTGYDSSVKHAYLLNNTYTDSVGTVDSIKTGLGHSFATVDGEVGLKVNGFGSVLSIAESVFNEMKDTSWFIQYDILYTGSYADDWLFSLKTSASGFTNVCMFLNYQDCAAAYGYAYIWYNRPPGSFGATGGTNPCINKWTTALITYDTATTELYIYDIPASGTATRISTPLTGANPLTGAPTFQTFHFGARPDFTSYHNGYFKNIIIGTAYKNTKVIPMTIIAPIIIGPIYY